jgi:hypothetical protein
MLLRSLAAFAALAALPLVVRAADEENPYKNAKVGDYATYKVKIKAGPIAQDGTITQTVTAKSDKQVTIKVSGKLGDVALPEHEEKIDLTKPYDPTKGGGGAIPGGGEAKVEKQKEGKEKVKVGDKEYDAVWTTYKFTAKLMDIPIEGDIKAWTAKDVPSGMVKMNMNATFFQNEMTITMELAETGNKPKKD